MADLLKDKNREIYKDLQNTDPRYNEELKASGSRAYNPFEHKSRELFSTYFVSRHNPDGDMHTAQWDTLTPEQTRTFDNYVMRRAYESNMRKNGVDDEQIALMRQWDADLKEAALNGTSQQLIESGRLTSEKYMEAAKQQFDWDESMFNKYVATARIVAQEVYQPDGDGLFNITEQALTSFKDASHESLQEMYKWMSDDQKRQLQFDGIDNAAAFSNFFKAKSMEHEEAGKLHGWDKVANFFKAIPGAFVGALVETFTLPLTLVGLAAAGVTWSWDNPVSQLTFKWAEEAKKGAKDPIEKAIGVNKTDASYKWGSVAGEGVELLAETALTFGAAALWKAGTTKIGTKLANKAMTKAVKSGSKKAIAKASKRMSKNLSKRIQNTATKMMRKSGSKKLTAEQFRKATDKVLLNDARRSLGKKVITDEELDLFRKGITKVVDNAETAAIIKMGRQGLLKVTKEEAAKMGGEFAREAMTTVAKQGAKKGIKEGLVAAAKSGTKEGVKKAEVKAAKKLSKEELKAARETARQWKGTYNKVAGLAAHEDKGEALKAIANLASKQGPVKRTLRYAFGKTDPLTRLFSIKSFANTAMQGREKGYSPGEAIARGIFAYATTNMIWGRMHFGGSTAQEKLMGRIFGEEALKGGAGMAKTVGMRSLNVFSSNLEMTIKMVGSEAIEEFIVDGFRKGQDGKMELGLTALKSMVNWSNIREKFVTALTMNVSGGTVGKITGLAARHAPIVTRMQKIKATRFIDGKMSSGEGIGAELWGEYKDRVREEKRKQNSKSKLPLGEKRLRDEDIVDDAIALASAESSEVAVLATRFYVEHTASEYGYNLAKYEKNYKELVDEEVLRVNKSAFRIDKEKGLLEGDDNATKHQRETESEYKLYMQRSVARSANVEGQPDVIEIDGMKIENTEPRVMVAGYAFFKNMKIKDYNDKAEVDKAIKDSQEQARNLRDKLLEDKEGKEVWKGIAELPDSLLHNIMIRLNEKSESNPELYLKIRKELLDVINKKNELSKEDYVKKLNHVLIKYSDQTGEFNEYANEENSKGNNDADKLKNELDPAFIVMKEGLVDSINTGADAEITKAVKDVYDIFALDSKEEKESKPMQDRIDDMFEYLEKLHTEGSGGGKKLSKENYLKSVSKLFDYLSSSESQEIKDYLNGNPKNKKIKAIKVVQKIFSKAKISILDAHESINNKLKSLLELHKRIEDSRVNKENNRLTKKELDDYNELVNYFASLEKSITLNGKAYEGLVEEVYRQLGIASNVENFGGTLKEFFDNQFKEIKKTKKLVSNKESSTMANLSSATPSTISKAVPVKETQKDDIRKSVVSVVEEEKEVPKNEESSNEDQVPLNSDNEVNEQALNDQFENKKESTLDVAINKTVKKAEQLLLTYKGETSLPEESINKEAIEKELETAKKDIVVVKNVSQKVKEKSNAEILGIEYKPKEEFVETEEDDEVETKEKETDEEIKALYEKAMDEFDDIFKDDDDDKCL